MKDLINQPVQPPYCRDKESESLIGEVTCTRLSREILLELGLELGSPTPTILFFPSSQPMSNGEGRGGHMEVQASQDAISPS